MAYGQLGKWEEISRQRKFRFRHILIPLLIVILLAAGGMVFTVTRIMPVSSIAAVLKGDLKWDLPDAVDRWVEGQTPERDYSTLPPLLEMRNGKTVATAGQFELRREEILRLFEENVYGPFPEPGSWNVDYRVLEETPDALEGRAVRKQVEMIIRTPEGESRALLLLYLPRTDQPVPVFIGLNFKGNHSINPSPEIMYSFYNGSLPADSQVQRGIRQYRWPVREIVDRGFGLATIHHDDFAPDSSEEYTSRLIRLFPEIGMGAVGAWAFGLMRGVDYLAASPAVDSDRIIAFGHSRLGKTALWAGANDPGISMVISNGSGSTGAALSRSNRGETVSAVNRFFPYWFTDLYKTYSRHENLLPLDQHMLLACIAPRKLFVSSGTKDYWADPEGEFLSLVLAGEAWTLFGLPDLGTLRMPPAGVPVTSGNLAYYLRDGYHDITLENWKQFMDFAESE